MKIKLLHLLQRANTDWPLLPLSLPSFSLRKMSAAATLLLLSSNFFEFCSGYHDSLPATNWRPLLSQFLKENKKSKLLLFSFEALSTQQHARQLGLKEFYFAYNKMSEGATLAAATRKSSACVTIKV